MERGTHSTFRLSGRYTLIDASSELELLLCLASQSVVASGKCPPPLLLFRFIYLNLKLQTNQVETLKTVSKNRMQWFARRTYLAVLKWRAGQITVVDRPLIVKSGMFWPSLYCLSCFYLFIWNKNWHKVSAVPPGFMWSLWASFLKAALESLYSFL